MIVPTTTAEAWLTPRSRESSGRVAVGSGIVGVGQYTREEDSIRGTQKLEWWCNLTRKRLNARLLRRKERDASRSRPRSFTSQRALVQDDKQTAPLPKLVTAGAAKKNLPRSPAPRPDVVLRLEVFRGELPIIIYHAPNAILEQGDMKVDEEADWDIEQTQMGEQLCFVDRMQSFFTLCLHDHPSFDNQVGTKPTFQLHGSIDQRHRFLPFNLQPNPFYFVSQARLIRRFQKPRSQVAMNLN